jgi:hypothetical protein
MPTRMTSRRMIGVVGVLLAAAFAVGGCCPGEVNCAPAVSDARTPVGSANLPAGWCDPNYASFRVVATTGPYRVGDYALDRLRDVLRDQAGLGVEVLDGNDTGLPATGVLDVNQVVQAGWVQVPSTGGAAVAVVVVEKTNSTIGTYGFIRWRFSPRPTAVMVLHRGSIQSAAFGVIPTEIIEATVVVHEIGHWLGVPARDYHRSLVDGSHCTNARCVMYKGLSVNTPCVVLANLSSGIPLRFGPECAEELGEMWGRREPNR